MTTEQSLSRPAAADHLAIALDSDDLVAALRTARRLRPWFSVAKVGLELYSGAGPDALSALEEEGFLVFVDLKLHDIPTTVRRAARVLGAMGVGYTTVHVAGGEAMVRAAAEGLADGAASAGAPRLARLLGVTVLTSEADPPPGVLTDRAALAKSAGCAGVVCAARDLAVVRAAAPGLETVVPGIRPAGAPADDQARSATPAEAIAAGADLLVIGRGVTAADDPEAAAASLSAEVERALLARHAR